MSAALAGASRTARRHYRLAIAHTETRIMEIDRAIEQIARTAPYVQAVGALRCFRGIETVTALTLLAELHDFRRFPHPRALMGFIGFVPRGEFTTASRPPRG